MKEPITQKHYCGCGAACVAFILNKTYDEIIIEVGERKAELIGLYCSEIQNILRPKYDYYKKYCSKVVLSNGFVDNDIVFLKRSKIYPFGHYLVYYKDFWMDPWINYKDERYIKYAKSGYRDRLPYSPSYIITSNKLHN